MLSEILFILMGIGGIIASLLSHIWLFFVIAELVFSVYVLISAFTAKPKKKQ
jgi:hypothetical protein